ncbi:MAG: hypothetical protein IPO21_20335 [Bacteroidales bacterium]|nr:hypothetical protein [Bacteroidales bacterium]
MFDWYKHSLPDAHLKIIYLLRQGFSFHGAILKTGSEEVMELVRLRKTVLPENTVPIKLDRMRRPSSDSPQINMRRYGQVQKPLNFPLSVYGMKDQRRKIEQYG